MGPLEYGAEATAVTIRSKGSSCGTCIAAVFIVLSHGGGAVAIASDREATSQAASPQLEQELNAVREDLRKAFNSGDLELLLSYCHPQVIATWPNGDVAVGHDGVRKIINTLVKSEQRPFESYQVNPTVENRVVLNDGQVVVSRGQFNDEYTLARPKGQQVHLGSLWTATLIKSNDRWLITSFHLSANAFDNPVISLYLTLQRTVAGAIGGVAGLIVGAALGVWWTRRRLKGR
jgi:ketosteroid isomerase-like protein